MSLTDKRINFKQGGKIMFTLAGLKNTQEFQQSGILLRFAATQEADSSMTPEEIQKEYAENIATVCAYTTAIENLNVNIIATPVPKWYTKEFKQKFVDSKAHAATWTNDIMHLLKELPDSIIDYDILYKSNAGDIIDLCNLLKKTPSKDTEEKLKKAITKLVNGVTTKKDLIQNVINLLDQYIAQIGKDNDFFDEAYKSACGEIDVDKEKLKEFEKNKKELEAEIKRCQDVILGTGISGAVVLAAAPVALAFGPIGIVIGVIAFLASFALLITAITESAICAQKESALSACVSNMNDMTKTVQSLTIFSDELKKVIEAATAAKGAAQAIHSCWTALENQMNDLIKNIGECDEKAASKLYDDIIKGMEDEEKEWDKIVASAKNYANVNIEVKKEVQQIYKSA